MEYSFSFMFDVPLMFQFLGHSKSLYQFGSEGLLSVLLETHNEKEELGEKKLKPGYKLGYGRWIVEPTFAFSSKARGEPLFKPSAILKENQKSNQVVFSVGHNMNMIVKAGFRQLRVTILWLKLSLTGN